MEHVHGPGRSLEGGSALAVSEIEVYMGIHNEPGSLKMTCSYEELVETMLGQMLDSKDYDRYFVPWSRGDQWVLLIQTKGLFVEPTIFSDVKPSMKIMQEEILGPVCSVAKFKDVHDAIRIGSDTTCGLATAVHTRGLDTAIAWLMIPLDVSRRATWGEI
ncbi:aldehyde dehydrogenase (NAD(P)(+)) ald5 [Fusarium torreyae]|uniref:aldehyde dehydrogenase (NAD(+)) n=1 Tax=Fusarium torreyae TaxID=1237075 RepID=A0A9W8RMU8_9HYPO|nr:aldehyde dehydrogenase (NAD(P)(+)) ald5 [Fusarium torreyae]